MMEPDGRVAHKGNRALTLSLAAMMGSLLVLCVQLVLLQAGLVRAQGTLDVCSGCTYESIQEAIDAADPGDTIRVAQGVYTENLQITKSLSLLGGYESSGWTRDIELYETTIDGNRSGSVISVTNGCSTTIDGFTITNGATDYGGGIYVDGSSVTVANNKVEHNTTWFTRKAITITEPLLAGATVVSGTCDSSLVDGVYVWDVTTDLHLESGSPEPDGSFSVSFWQPLVEGHVIGVFGAYGYDEATVQPGLGVSEEASALAESLGEGYGRRFFGNPAESRGVGVELSGDLGQGNELSLRGGGIYLIDSTALITGNDIVSNAARDLGGGICVENSTVVIAGNDVVSNASGRVFPISWYWGRGGGIAILSGSEFTVSGNLLAENRMVRGGGGIYITDSVGSLVNNEIRANRTEDSPGAQALGGGIYVGNCSPLIEGNEIISNSLGTTEHPVYMCGLGGGVYLVGSSSLIRNNEIVGNRVAVAIGGREEAQGGGVFAADSVERSVYWDSHVQPGGGDVWPVIVGNRIEANSVSAAEWLGTGVGGGVSAWGVSLSLVGNHIVSNTAGYDGAGVSVRQYRFPYEGPWVTALISGNVVLGNVLYAQPWSDGTGGVAVWGRITSTVKNNVIADNEGMLAGGLGIAIVDAGAGRVGAVEGNRIVGNEAETVGGVYACGEGEMAFTNNTISGNTGEKAEGGIDICYGTYVLSHNEIMSNSGALAGGLGVRDTESHTTTVTLDSNWIVANQSTGPGGGMRIWPHVVFTLTNNVIADNSAEGLGGGICISNSQGSLINNTIAENEEGAGEGIYLDGTAEATILNNVIVSHTYGIYNAGSGTPDVTYNDVWGNSVGDYYGATPGVGNISSDPQFVDPGNWDYHLWLSSPAVNAAHPDTGLAPSWDIDGDVRPMGGRVDMGADEVPFEVWVWKSDVPDPVLPGELVTYTIRLSNVGEESIGGLVMTDRVPLNTSLHWASDDYEETGGVVSWDVGSLNVGEMVTRTMVVEVDEGLTDGTMIENGEYGASSEELTRPVMGMPVLTRVGVPLLEISKVDQPDPVQPGDTLTYTLAVTNSGGIPATDVSITDRVPVNTQFSWASDGGLESGGVVTWDILQLGSNQSLTRTLVVTVAEGVADGTQIENGEYGLGCQEVPEAVMGPLVRTTVGVPVLLIGKSDEPDPVSPGGELTYTIVVTNDGGWKSTGLMITDRIPADTTCHWASDGGQLIGDVLSWTVSSLEPGHSLERTLVVTVSEYLSDSVYINNDEYGVNSDGTEAVMGASVTTLVGLPILTISKEAEPELVFPGGEVAYTLTVTNEGHHVATGVVITDRVPLNASFSWVLDGGELVGDEVRWTGLTVGPGESLSVRWGAAATSDLLVEEVVNESYGAQCFEVSEVAMGEAVHTPLLRYSWWFPLAMKYEL